MPGLPRCAYSDTSAAHVTRYTHGDAGSLSCATMLGRVFHLCFDALLVSVVLSGIKRNTGLSLSLTKVPNKDIRQLILGYLEAGEWVRVGW